MHVISPWAALIGFSLAAYAGDDWFSRFSIPGARNCMPTLAGLGS
jgi:hypothetical protein